MSNTVQLSGGVKVGSFSTANKPAAEKGIIYFDTDLNKFQQCVDGSTYVDIPTGSIVGVIYADGTAPFAADQSMGGFKLTNLGTPTVLTDAATKDYVDTSLVGVVYANGSVAFLADQSMSGFKLTNLSDAAAGGDATPLSQVNTLISANAANQTLSNLTSPTAVNQNLNFGGARSQSRYVGWIANLVADTVTFTITPGVGAPFVFPFTTLITDSPVQNAAAFVAAFNASLTVQAAGFRAYVEGAPDEWNPYAPGYYPNQTFIVGPLGVSFTETNDKPAMIDSFAGNDQAALVSGMPRRVTNMLDPVSPQDAATKAYVDATAGDYLPLAGGTMSGTLSLPSIKTQLGSLAIDVNGRALHTSSGTLTKTLDWENKQLYGNANNTSQAMDWSLTTYPQVYFYSGIRSNSDILPENGGSPRLGNPSNHWVEAWIEEPRIKNLRDQTSVIAFNVTNRVINDTSGNSVADFSYKELYSADGNFSVSWDVRKLFDNTSTEQMDWNTPGTVTFSGIVAMSTNKITGMGDPVSAQDATTKAYVDAASSAESAARTAEDLTFVKLNGSRTMTGALNMGNQMIHNASELRALKAYLGIQEGQYSSPDTIYPTGQSDIQILTYPNAEDVLRGNMGLYDQEGLGNVAGRGFLLTLGGKYGWTGKLPFAGIKGAKANGVDANAEGHLEFYTRTTAAGILQVAAKFNESSNLDMLAHKIANLADGTNPNDAVNKSQLDTKALLASPTFTGTPAAPTASGGTNTTQIATTAFVTAAIAANPSGDVIGPASSTDNAVARFDGVTGKLIQDSSILVSDTGSMALGSASVLTPDSAAKLLQIGSKMTMQNVVGSQVWIGQNAYYTDGAGWVRPEAGYGMGIRMHESPGGVGGDGSIMFVTVPSGAAGAFGEPTERMTIRNTGKVGIGISDPATELQVVGTITATKVTGMSAPTAASDAATKSYVDGVTSTVAARVYASATAVTGSLATVVWTTTDNDTHAAFSAAGFTCPVDGRYSVAAAIALSGTFILNSTNIMELQRDGIAVKNVTKYAGGAITQESLQLDDTSVRCLAGQVLRIQVSSSGTAPAIESSNTRNTFSVTRVGNY